MCVCVCGKVEVTECNKVLERERGSNRGNNNEGKDEGTHNTSTTD